MQILTVEFINAVETKVKELVAAKELEPKPVKPANQRGKAAGSSVTRVDVAKALDLDSKDVFIMSCIGNVISSMVGYNSKKGVGIQRV